MFNCQATEKYKKVFITGNVGSKTNEFRNVFIKEMNILGVEVYKFEDILREILPYLENGNPLNPVIKTVQLTKFFG